MLFFPYKADVNLGRWPIMTLIVCVICIWVFGRQALSEYRYTTAINQFCNQSITRDELMALRYLPGEPGQHYCEVMLKIRSAPDHKQAMRDIAEAGLPTSFYPNKLDNTAYLYSTLERSFSRFDRAVPKNLTDELHYDPRNPSLTSMVTAAFSHGSWGHLIGNLVFFFAFAASVEVITGYAYYFGFIMLSAVATHLAYTYSVRDAELALPTVGLSGVVMTMMAFLATVIPALRIRVFFWFLIFIRTFRVPALVIAALYVLQNIYDYSHQDLEDNTNYVAHLSGAFLGVAMGIIYRVRNKEFLGNIVRDL